MRTRESAIRTLFGLTVLDYSATDAEFKEFLQLGVDENGKSITEFWIDSFDHRAITKKPLSELLRELNDKEVILYIHPQTKRVVRRARSVKIILLNPDTELELVEVGHMYHYEFWFKEGGKTAFKPSDRTFSYSETIILGESWRRTVLRCLHQEAGMERTDLIKRPGCSRIEAIAEADGKVRREHRPLRDSAAYHGIVTDQQIRAWCYILSKKFNASNPPPSLNDNGKYALHDWRPYLPASTKYSLEPPKKLGQDT